MGNEPVRQEPILGDARERTVETLCAQFARDALETAEFERRIDLAYRASTTAELTVLTADLPAIPMPRQAGAAAAATPTPGPAAGRVDPELVPSSQFVVAIMSGAERKGAWIPARNIYSVAFMGGAVLDFRAARFGPGVTEITIFAFMGGVEIIVPPGLHVQCDGIGVMGAFDHQTESDPPAAGAPMLRINGLALMGGVDITMRLPGESASEAKRRRKLERRRRLPRR